MDGVWFRAGGNLGRCAVPPVDMNLPRRPCWALCKPYQTKRHSCLFFHPPGTMTLSTPSHIRSHYTSSLIFPQGSIEYCVLISPYPSRIYLPISLNLFLLLSFHLSIWTSCVKEEGMWEGDKSSSISTPYFSWECLIFSWFWHCISLPFARFPWSVNIYCPLLYSMWCVTRFGTSFFVCFLISALLSPPSFRLPKIQSLFTSFFFQFHSQ